MSASRTVRLAAAGALGLAAGGALWSRASQIEPYLDIRADRVVHNDNFSWWQVTIKARGGETIERIRVEAGTGTVGLPAEGSRVLPLLRAGWSWTFRVEIVEPATTKASVRIVQTGPIPRTYDVPLEVGP